MPRGLFEDPLFVRDRQAGLHPKQTGILDHRTFQADRIFRPHASAPLARIHGALRGFRNGSTWQNLANAKGAECILFARGAGELATREQIEGNKFKVAAPDSLSQPADGTWQTGLQAFAATFETIVNTVPALSPAPGHYLGRGIRALRFLSGCMPGSEKDDIPENADGCELRDRRLGASTGGIRVPAE